MVSELRRVKVRVFGREFELETGRLAKQANGAVLARYEGTAVLATVVAGKDRIEGEDFLPLTVNYQERAYAAGRIPGGYFKREGRPSEKEVLTSRLIDRPIRPLIPKDFTYPMQIIVTVLSADQDNDPDVLSVTAASAALCVSDIPFDGPLAAVRVGRINGEFVCNPVRSELERSDMDIVVAGTKEAIVMVEGGANEVPEADIVEALLFGHRCLQEFIKPQEELISGLDIVKREIPSFVEDPVLTERVVEFAREQLKEAICIPYKVKRRERIQEVYQKTIETLLPQFPGMEVAIAKAFEKLKRELVREIVINEKRRIDGRGYKDIRPISGEVGFLPRTHGSALFTRGETQVAVMTTLGTAYDEQRIDALEGEVTKRFMLHYNFPPFSVGEIGTRLAPGRREIGHGALAERALVPVLPSKENFPYTIRVVSDVLESNGSSSMATVCGGSLSLMDAGVPIRAHVGGIAMGLIKDEDRFIILSDILGDEDQLGDMDFKVAGTTEGVTALQMDIKVKGITREILTEALQQAREGRLFIIDKMNEIIKEPRPEISAFAPRIISIQVKPEKIKDVIGPGGRTIKKIIEETGTTIDIEESGRVNIAAYSKEACEKAAAMIKEIVQEVEVGKIYLGTVKKILDFGAIVELFHGVDGLVHISELAPTRVRSVSDIVREGDEILVKCIGIEKDGRIRLSRKEALGENIEDYRKGQDRANV
ncbi:MAG: polyribonucleotide nucleotidyltransferase [Deltaproteobacteria bacterium]|nr:MAG: polyribonucleotide nucleotidyltransferase [Deltaproteobacteria bacterium]